MNRRTLCVGVALFAVPFLMFAQPEPGMANPRQQHRMMPLLKDLNLTEAQQKQFEDMRFELQKQMVAQSAKVADARIELRQLYSQDAPDQGAVSKKLQEIGRLQTERKQLWVDHWFKVNKILTPDQQKVWKRALEREGGFRGPRDMQRGGMMHGGRGMR